MKVKLLEDFDHMPNDRVYYKDEIIEVEEYEFFSNGYAHYFIKKDGKETMDWIPKRVIKII